jgi:sialic acid synthase SpsE
MQKFDLAGIELANNSAPVFLPDIGTFFDQDISVAQSMVHQLKDAGVKIVKGEILHRPDICLDDGTMESYFDPEKGYIKEPWRKLIERKVLSLHVYEKIFSLCKELGMEFVVSVYDKEGASFARETGASGIKIASSNITHQPLIEYISGLDLPMFIDSGRSDIEEISRAFIWARDAGARKIVIQHSPPAPPAPATDHNLHMMMSLSNIFSCPASLSDHHKGPEMLFAACALGVAALEKGVCPDGAAIDIDVAHALPISKVGETIRSCEAIHEALGSNLREMRRDRERYNQRMGLIALRNLQPGQRLSEDDVDFAWPASGIGCEHWSLVKDWVVRCEIPKGNVIGWQSVEPPSS